MDIEVFDACVRPTATDADLRRYLPTRWRDWPLPRPKPFLYVVPGRGKDDAEVEALNTPAAVRANVFDAWGFRGAVLVPSTRGLLPDVDLSSAVCAATNEWLAAEWLDGAAGTVFGTICVDPRDPATAAAEIERWAEHPMFVQVAAPLQSHAPYGHRTFLPVWAAAAGSGLPVVFRIETAAGVDFWPTPTGYPRYYSEYAALARNSSLYHVFNLVTEGVFDVLPAFRVVFADGGHDMLASFLWRLDKDWRPFHTEVPWAESRPADYMRKHVRYIWQDSEGPRDVEQWKTWAAISDLADMVMFGSRFPADNASSPAAVSARLAPADAARVLQGNAADLYPAVAAGLPAAG